MVNEIQIHLNIYIYGTVQLFSYTKCQHICGNTCIATMTGPILAHQSDQGKEDLSVSLFNTCENHQLQMENV